MSNERTGPRPNEKLSAPKEQKQQQQQPAGRSGHGARSVIPHLRADIKARAVARVARRGEP